MCWVSLLLVCKHVCVSKEWQLDSIQKHKNWRKEGMCFCTFPQIKQKQNGQVLLSLCLGQLSPGDGSPWGALCNYEGRVGQRGPVTWCCSEGEGELQGTELVRWPGVRSRRVYWLSQNTDAVSRGLMGHSCPSMGCRDDRIWGTQLALNIKQQIHV